MPRFTIAFALLSVAACSQTPAPIQPGQASPSARATSVGTPPSAAGRCQGANWRATGYRHGISGFPPDTINTLTAACADAGVKVDRLAYSTGRLEGMALFCTAENGQRRALAGHPVTHNCPPTLAQDYEQGHAAGVRLR